MVMFTCEGGMGMEEIRREDRAAGNGARAAPLLQLDPVQAVWIGNRKVRLSFNRRAA
jgi:hypothetical protein